jgi:hypothetical protein
MQSPSTEEVAPDSLPYLPVTQAIGLKDKYNSFPPEVLMRMTKYNSDGRGRSPMKAGEALLHPLNDVGVMENVF